VIITTTTTTTTTTIIIIIQELSTHTWSKKSNPRRGQSADEEKAVMSSIY